LSVPKDVRLRLRLYIAGVAPNSQRAVANAKAACADHFAAAHELEVVDVMAEPERAVRDRVVVTPTLIKLFPGPEQRAIGDLSDLPLLLSVLGVPA
jgi:circadian clock protein KaiB